MWGYYISVTFSQVENLRNEVRTAELLLEKQEKLTHATDRKEQTKSFNDLENELRGKKDITEQIKREIAAATRMQKAVFNEIGNKFSVLKQSSPSLVHLIGKIYTSYGLFGKSVQVPLFIQVDSFLTWAHRPANFIYRSNAVYYVCT